jgi:hypothetical protein
MDMDYDAILGSRPGRAPGGKETGKVGAWWPSKALGA